MGADGFAIWQTNRAAGTRLGPGHCPPKSQELEYGRRDFVEILSSVEPFLLGLIEHTSERVSKLCSHTELAPPSSRCHDEFDEVGSNVPNEVKKMKSAASLRAGLEFVISEYD